MTNEVSDGTEDEAKAEFQSPVVDVETASLPPVPYIVNTEDV